MLADCPFPGYCPELIVRIINPANGHVHLTRALIDTGASCCSMPAFIAQRLGHTLHNGTIKGGLDTAGGKASAFVHSAVLELYHPVTRKPICKTNTIHIDCLDSLPVVLLGADGFLNNLILTVNYPAKTFSLKK